MAWLRNWENTRARNSVRRPVAGVAFVVLMGLALWLVAGVNARSQAQRQANLIGQSQAEVEQKNAGCVSCHVSTDEPTMHPTRTVRLACMDCHGGDSSARLPAGAAQNSAVY